MTQLTGVLKEIAEVAGEAAAISIAAAVGGMRVYIPARLRLGHWLVECVGRKSAERIAAHFAANGSGQRIDVPLCGIGAYPRLRRAIAKRVHEMDQAGASASEITRAVGITTRAVHRHRAAHRGKRRRDKRQGVLL